MQLQEGSEGSIIGPLVVFYLAFLCFVCEALGFFLESRWKKKPWLGRALVPWAFLLPVLPLTSALSRAVCRCCSEPVLSLAGRVQALQARIKIYKSINTGVDGWQGATHSWQPLCTNSGLIPAHAQTHGPWEHPRTVGFFPKKVENSTAGVISAHGHSRAHRPVLESRGGHLRVALFVCRSDVY